MKIHEIKRIFEFVQDVLQFNLFYPTRAATEHLSVKEKRMLFNFLKVQENQKQSDIEEILISP